MFNWPSGCSGGKVYVWDERKQYIMYIYIYIHTYVYTHTVIHMYIHYQLSNFTISQWWAGGECWWFTILQIPFESGFLGSQTTNVSHEFIVGWNILRSGCTQLPLIVEGGNDHSILNPSSRCLFSTRKRTEESSNQFSYWPGTWRDTCHLPFIVLQPTVENYQTKIISHNCGDWISSGMNIIFRHNFT